MIKIYNKPLIKAYSQSKLNSELHSFYIDWKNRYIRTIEDSSPRKEYLFYTLDQVTLNRAVTCSEAMGYGMVIFPIMSKFDSTAKEHFHAIYNYIKTYPSIYNKDLMAWQQVKDSEGNIINAKPETSSATDGDMDISYGLLLADKLWGKYNILNYKNEALKRIRGLMDSCVSTKDYILLLGDWVNQVEGINFRNVCRSSDFSSYIIREFIKIDSLNCDKWQHVLKRINSIISHQMKRESKHNGLMPDFFIKSKGNYIAPKFKVLENSHDGDYYFNSCRTPFRYSMDTILNNRPITKQLQILNHWIKSETGLHPKKIKSGYYIVNGPPGKSFGHHKDLSFIAPFLVSALIDKENDDWIVSLWEILMKKPIEKCTFYENTLKLLAMIVASGNWPIL